jgi:tetratricopeptide (TPR) repeat protein
MTRLEQLQQFLAEEPNDPFNIYSLALEYLKTDPSETMRLFETLVTRHHNYLATYYHFGKLCHESGDREKALAILEQGIAVARQQNASKALRELQSAYQEIQFED